MLPDGSVTTNPRRAGHRQKPKGLEPIHFATGPEQFTFLIWQFTFGPCLKYMDLPIHAGRLLLLLNTAGALSGSRSVNPPIERILTGGSGL